MSSVMDPFYLCDTSAALDGGSVNRDFRGPLFSANPSTVAASYPYSQHHKHLQHQQAERVVHQPQLADPTCSSPDEITKTDAGADSCNNMRNARDKSNLPLIKLKRRAQNRAAQQTYRDRRAKHVKDLETKLATLHAAQEDVLVENQRLRQEVRDLSSKIEILGATSTKAKGDLGSDVTRSSTTTGGTSAPSQNCLTDLSSDDRQRHYKDHPYCRRTAPIPADRLLQPGSTWDFIVSHDLFQRRLVDHSSQLGRLIIDAVVVSIRSAWTFIPLGAVVERSDDPRSSEPSSPALRSNTVTLLPQAMAAWKSPPTRKLFPEELQRDARLTPSRVNYVPAHPSIRRTLRSENKERGRVELSHVAYKPSALQHFDAARAKPRTVAPPQRHNCIRGNKQNAGDCGVAAPAPEDMRYAETAACCLPVNHRLTFATFNCVDGATDAPLAAGWQGVVAPSEFPKYGQLSPPTILTLLHRSPAKAVLELPSPQKVLRQGAAILRAANSRRAATSCRTHLLDGDYSNVDFINTLSNDIARFYGVKVAEEAFANVILRHSPYLWSQQPAVAKGLELVSMSAETFAPFLVSNEHSPVSRLVSCNSRDLYGLLVRMSLSNETAPSLATRHAIAALCFQHRGMDGVALSHQTLAIRSLQVALNDPLGPSEALQSLAASRLLNIFETVNVNASAQSWASFFCGTKELARVVHESIGFSDTECKMLLDWSYYCDIMYKFSIRHWRGPPAAGSLIQCRKLHQLKTSAIVVASPSRHHTVNYLGYCSSELLGIIGQMIDAVVDRDYAGRPAKYSKESIDTLNRFLFFFTKHTVSFKTWRYAKRPGHYLS
ncbi:hypothetical protein PCL_04546 [Purpureocillium lilacinum]|uniref:BZIP domain-containing protein n=1 Tax=Purpureocillium lilacinum TaxID=33203 RepID=A0A2U3DXQ3_PURLI|nr:hypothetical protein PCL_04546 [Purpureocillium lilacinum]